MPLYIITGGPCSGKTTLINALAQEFSVVHESAREVIKEQLVKGTRLVPWDDLEGFSRHVVAHIAYKQGLFQKSELPVFCDRGLYDVEAYLRAGNIPVSSEIAEYFEEIKYHSTVFLCPPWEEVYQTDNERKENFEQGVVLYNHLVKTYADRGFEVVVVPHDNVQNRVSFIRSMLRNG